MTTTARAQAKAESLRTDLELLRPRFERLQRSAECEAIRASWKPPLRPVKEPKPRPTDNNHRWTARGINELQEIYLLNVQVMRGKAVIVGDDDWNKQQESKMEKEQEHEDALARMAKDLSKKGDAAKAGLRPFGTPQEEAVPERMKTSRELAGEVIQRQERQRSVDAPWRALKAHPFADLLPMMSEETKTSLTISIRKYGCMEPGVLLDGMILDGRNRHSVCKALDVPFPVRDFDPKRDGEPFDFVLRHNVERRQMTKCQLCVVALGLVNTTHGGNRRNNSSGTSAPCSTPVFTLDQAAERFGVSERYIRKVKTVLQHCDEVEREQLLQGKFTLGEMVHAKRINEPLEEPLAKVEGPSIQPVNDEPGPSSGPEPRPAASPPVAQTSVDMQRMRQRLATMSKQPAEAEVEDVEQSDELGEEEALGEAETEVEEEKDEQEKTAAVIASVGAGHGNISRRAVIVLPSSASDAERVLWELRRLVKSYELSMSVEVHCK